MSDLKFPRGGQQTRRVRLGTSRSTQAEAWEELDLSTFGDEELVRESRREVIRRSRDNRRAARADGDVARWERVVFARLLIAGACVATLVVLVGLLSGDDDLVRTGLAGWGAACGAGFLRLRDALRHRPRR